MTNKARLQTVLQGGIPDIPPHFEMMFQLAPEMFGLTGEGAAFDIAVAAKCIEAFDYAAVSSHIPYLPQLKQELGDQALIFTLNDGGIFQMPTGEGMVEFAVSLYEEPEEMHALARRRLAAAKELARKEADWGVDFLIQNTDFGFNTQPFLLPEMFREFVVPYMTEFVAHVHDLGIPILLHSDGHIAPLLADIAATGVDGIQSIDPQGGMDIQTVRNDYPDWILMGNVACNMLQETVEEEIRASVRYCMTHGGIGKPYIFSTSNCVFAGMPPESYRIMLDEYRRIVAAAAV